MRRLYSLFMYLVTPIVMGYFALRGLRDSRYWHRWNERLAYAPAVGPPGRIMVHGSSMGEINAASPLVQALLKVPRSPGLLITTFTPTGAGRARELFGQQAQHCHLPLDLPSAMRRFLDRQQPSLIIIMETEIWPNLIHFATTLGIPVLIANARLSEKSVHGYLRLKALIRPALGRLRAILAQSVVDGARFIRCGAEPGAVIVTGNLKFDADVPASLVETGELLRASWGVNRPVLVAGSTHEDDEASLLEAFPAVLKKHPHALLVLAPRHPERFQEAARKASDAGLNTLLRSAGKSPTGEIQCLVVDTMGLLPSYYAAADVAFVGGTIADIGGHNVLEPAALGKPLLVGPHTRNVGETAARLIEAGAARRVQRPAEIAAALIELFGDASRRDRTGQSGSRLVEKGRGALERTLAEIRRVREESLREGRRETQEGRRP